LIFKKIKGLEMHLMVWKIW